MAGVTQGLLTSASPLMTHPPHPIGMVIFVLWMGNSDIEIPGNPPTGQACKCWSRDCSLRVLT